MADLTDLTEDLACYLQGAAAGVSVGDMQAVTCQYNAYYDARQSCYQLPLGRLQRLDLTLYLPRHSSAKTIKSARTATLKAVLAWYKTSCVADSNDNQYKHDRNDNGQSDTQNHDKKSRRDVLIFDIVFFDETEMSADIPTLSPKQRLANRLTHHFDTAYFMEDLVIDMSGEPRPLQIFSYADWQKLSSTLQTPCELWRFFHYHLQQLQQSLSDQRAHFERVADLVTQFLYNPSVFTHAITIDNALIKAGVQDAPNAALIAMTLAHKNQSATAQMYQQHMAQAATLWSQLSGQMIAMCRDERLKNSAQMSSEVDFLYWQQQLLDESLFSRHELVRTLYRHPKQPDNLKSAGYVVHQHSYESLGRHYVLIFYGQNQEGQHSKQAIQPNLAKIAQDVATRLPIAALHHVIILGVEFINEGQETFIDIDLWIQPVATMTQRERQLTKQIQQLQQQKMLVACTSADNDRPAEALPQVRLNLTIPACKSNK
ncbi:hypothetical protein [Psychrobacter sp. VH5]|uniref:hypothetical protein n=1 Tax=Psychrobacter sp. VH5 TaxID=3423439 RepID=UPI003D6527F2